MEASVKQFFITDFSKCPYLDDQQERKIFAELVGDDAQALNNLLTHNGFRRSQSIIYRPLCKDCEACRSTRVLIDSFSLSVNMKKISKINSDLIGVQCPTEATSEMYDLFQRYVKARHKDGGMSMMTVRDFTLMVEDSHVATHVIEYRRRGMDSGITQQGEGALIAAIIVDKLEDGLSLVYSFYDPDLFKRSLGTFIILDQINRTRRLGLPYLYLGYLIKNSPKMAYKARFKPQEYFSSDGWVAAVDT